MKVLTKLRNTFNTENGKIGPQYNWVNYKTVQPKLGVLYVQSGGRVGIV